MPAAHPPSLHAAAADPSRRPTAAQVLAHPWCSQGVDAQVVLDANLAQLEASLATPPSTQVRQVEGPGSACALGGSE